MEENNTPSPDSEYILAAITYFPFVSLVMIFTQSKRYFVKYNAGHAILIYTISLAILLTYIAIYILLRAIMTDTFILNLVWGFIFSIHLLANFIYIFYCSLQAYLGRYLIVPFVTNLFYKLFQR